MQNTAFSTKKTLNIGGNLFQITKPLVMGIVNVTPDSFYDGGVHQSEKSILAKAERFIEEGATFVDIGGYSSRPGASHISLEDELGRVLPAIKLIARTFPGLIISVDTFRSEVAAAAVNEGARMVNDISGGQLDSMMFSTVARLRVPYILMHMKGSPQTMTQEAAYNNVTRDVMDYFRDRILAAHEAGVKDIIIDPGFGFAKTREHNFQLLANLSLFKALGYPVLVGLSRKSMIWKTLGITADHALNGTTVMNTVALQNGADILRVHDVMEAVQTVKLLGSLPLAHRDAES